MDNISAEFRIQHGEVKGLILCDDREEYDTLSGDGEKLTEALRQDGYIVKNISAPSNATYKGEIIFNSKDDNHKHLTRFRLLVGDQHITVWKTDDDVKCGFDIGVDEND